LLSDLAASEILATLGKAARRGRLPGFDARGADGFHVEADAVPFPYELVGSIGTGERGGSIVRLHLRRLTRLPLIFGAVLALTVWPGVWLTDSLLSTYWPSYGRWSADTPWLTYAWYLPITLVPIPWMWRSLARKSRDAALASAREQAATIAELVGPRQA